MNLEIHAASHECRDRRVSLNGIELSSDSTLEKNNGTIIFNVALFNGLGEREIAASWEMQCLQHKASILSVTFTDIVDQHEINELSGFTVSYRQSEVTPSILRLQARPLESLESIHLLEWENPREDQRLDILPIPFTSMSHVSALQAEIQRMETLLNEMDQLRFQLHQSGLTIKALIKHEFKSCSSVKCLWRTAVERFPDVKKILALKFEHHHAKPRDKQSQHSLSDNCSDDGCTPEIEHIDLVDPGFIPEDLPLSTIPSTYTPNPEIAHPPSEEPNYPDHLVHPPPPLPPMAKPQPEIDNEESEMLPHMPEHLPLEGPGSSFLPHDHPEVLSGDRHRGPQGYNHHGHMILFSDRIMRTASILLLITIISSIIFACIKRKVKIFRDPRRRAERAARREERDTRRAYRRAACRHKWTRFWSRFQFRSPNSSSDYEEKREMILEQEGSANDVVQGEIRSLRQAHEIVGELLRAEEGRARLYRGSNLRSSQQTLSDDQSDIGIGSSSRSEPLPSYGPPPPTYEEEITGDFTVVDGFSGYTPSSSGDTPDSSVIDCSPRLSFDTGMTPSIKG